MKFVESMTIKAFQAQLKKQGSGVPLDLASMPKPADGYTAVRATLADSDMDRTFLWFEFRKHTKNGTAKLTDALRESTREPRIRQLIEGDASKGWAPIDLRVDSGCYPMLVTNDFAHGPLYGLDGNHRLVAHFLTGKAFDGVPAFVCTHVKMLEWAYIMDAARTWFQHQLAK